MNIKEVQPEIYQQFQLILQKNKLSHSYLFTGNFGTLDMAIFLAQSIFCQNKQDGVACLECRSCRLVANRDFADLHILEAEGQTIKTDQVRSLQKIFTQSGFESEKQVVIIDGAEKMHVNAANSLLKSMEEPNNDIYIFLLAEEENLVLDTIKSRSQLFRFPRQSKYIKNILIENDILPTTAEVVSHLANTIDEAYDLSKSSWFDDAMKIFAKFTDMLLVDKDAAYLSIAGLLVKFKEKKEQARAFSLITFYLSKKFPDLRAVDFLEKNLKAERMWKSNVNFQSCLEYIVLGESK